MSDYPESLRGVWDMGRVQTKPPKRQKRAPKPLRSRCAPKRTKRPRKQRKTSRAAQGRLADKLFSLIVRRGGMAQCWEHLGDVACAGSLQCAHVVSRSYRSTRWDEQNAFPLCAGAHVYYTHHPLEWERFVIRNIGAADYEALKARALAKWDGDLDGVLVRLAARAVALGIPSK